MTRLLLVSIDGLAGFSWRDPRARMPTLRRLGERGAIADRLEAIFPTTTWPTHVSLVTGVGPHLHGVPGFPAGADWPCTRRAASLDWNLPFFKDQRTPQTKETLQPWPRRARWTPTMC